MQSDLPRAHQSQYYLTGLLVQPAIQRIDEKNDKISVYWEIVDFVHAE